MLPLINNKTVKSSKFNVIVSEYAPIGRYDLGFIFYYDQNRENMYKMIKNMGDRTVYQVYNPFELYITSIDKRLEMQNRIKEFIGNKTDITDNITMHIWEIIMLFNMTSSKNTFNIIHTNQDDIKIAIDNFSKKVTKNTITYGKTNVDIAIITNVLPINKVLYRESILFISIINRLIEALDTLKNNGKIVMQIDDMFTTPTCKMIQLCRILFDNVYIYKPFFSRLEEAEKYLICVNFNIDVYKSIKDKLHKSIKLMDHNKGFIFDFMEDIDIDKQLMDAFAYINMCLAGWQHRTISEMLSYVNKDNFAGQDYNNALDDQLKAIEFFSTKFFPINVKDYAFIQKEFMNELNRNIEEMKQFVNES